jgi:adenylate cyclase
MQHPATLAFEALLAARNKARTPSGRAHVDAEIRQQYERPMAVMIGDMSGFSRITQAHGILHFLGLIQRMRALAGPIVRGHGGNVVKFEADNLYASFPGADAALEAAIDLHTACEREATTPDDSVRMSLGLGFGPVLDIGGVDFYGDQVNLASKLGEDIAEAGEILVSQAFLDASSDRKGWFWDKRTTRISNIGFDYYSLMRKN